MLVVDWALLGPVNSNEARATKARDRAVAATGRMGRMFTSCCWAVVQYFFNVFRRVDGFQPPRKNRERQPAPDCLSPSFRLPEGPEGGRPSNNRDLLSITRLIAKSYSGNAFMHLQEPPNYSRYYRCEAVASC